MIFLLTALFVAVGAILLARSRYLHPGDYIVGAALAVFLAGFVVVLSPSASEHRRLVGHGMPATALSRSAFLLDHGAAIELASLVLAAGMSAAAVVRRRVSPQQYA
jgi:hypothetical protein